MISILTAVLVFVSSAGAQTPAAAEALLDLIVFGPGESIDATQLPAAVRSEVEHYLARTKRLRVPRADKPRSGEQQMVQYARMRYEHRLAALSDDPAARALAEEYVRALVPCYEWEGYHDCPEREARFAAYYLARHPGGPFSAYLPLLAAHRWICAAEGYAYEKDAGAEAAARREYETTLRRARATSDPMIRFAADTLASRGTCFSSR